MSVCPVCANPEAKLAGAKRSPGSPAGWSVSCPTCPVPFEITGKDLNMAASNPREAEGRRRRWAQMLKEASQKGDTIARLY